MSTAIESEREFLRAELLHLKNCQLQYFTLSVTTTGAVFSLGSSLGGGNPSPLFFLAPLLIIIPCWWIFFDKATTITRLVGYITALETILANEEPAGERLPYIGWERSLNHYRRQRVLHPENFITGVRPLKLLWSGLKAAIPLFTSHRYWAINWCTYFVLASLCWGLGTGFLLDVEVWVYPGSIGAIASGAVIAASAFATLYWLGDLVEGSRSYQAHERRWPTVLRSLA